MSSTGKDWRQKTHDRGQRAERMAIMLLVVKGYTILARRYRTPHAEIDLIAKRGNTVVFIEVKYRPATDTGLYAIGFAQQQRIASAAEMFLSARQLIHCDARFDAIILSPKRLPVHVQNAWQAAALR